MIKPEWFGGNQDGVVMMEAMRTLAHIWDDLIDRDKQVSSEDVNKAFHIALVELPMNPLYQFIQKEVAPMWLTTILAYDTANRFEKAKDAHGIEIAHNLRYAAGHIIAYAVHVCVGTEKAREYLPEIWKIIVAERFEDYSKEHLRDI